MSLVIFNSELSDRLTRIADFQNKTVNRFVHDIISAYVNNVELSGSIVHEFTTCLSDPEFRRYTTHIDRERRIIEFARTKKPELFLRIALKLKGSKRIWAALKEHDIECSGRSTDPKPICDGAFYICGNMSLRRKEVFVARLLRRMGFSCIAVRDAVRSIGERLN